MAKKITFENSEFIDAIKAAAAAGESRVGLVKRLMALKGVEVTDKTRQQWYSNVTQRTQALTKAGVKLPVLAKAEKVGGGKRIGVAALNAQLATTEETV